MKRLYKSENDRRVCGVCGGLSEYFGIDATLFRIAFAILAVFGSAGIWLYLLAALIIPRRPNDDFIDM